MTTRIYVKKHGGDDAYSYAVFASHIGVIIAGLERNEAKYHARRIAQMFSGKGYKVTGTYGGK